ncbi:unnamed protein product [Acanthoscelides obtectus]|uniref:Uncharacterized protein n=1 Tax=Acanthoscelides obtectus TaxID=200917 RepID=A0A9P0PRK7_ACAOB|nr:unnamed protein product [Acanthoscelides obtectus]CAK1620707.1 hypothetical protein AOBTE_LOCUS519 [Acanthoscelides obtectus]
MKPNRTKILEKNTKPKTNLIFRYTGYSLNYTKVWRHSNFFVFCSTVFKHFAIALSLTKMPTVRPAPMSDMDLSYLGFKNLRYYKI